MRPPDMAADAEVGDNMRTNARATAATAIVGSLVIFWAKEKSTGVGSVDFRLGVGEGFSVMAMALLP
jgi:hypothetical protein